ncbi:MAG TPA: RNA 2',3'-cyclic phosphodiesterase [Gemmatimonadota bacterium]|nr:RNA 2',3'-cyclic phosphodiesterase [Gemmatimonadota bacterium]
MRAFVALPCPSRLRAALAEALEEWRRTEASVRWSRPEGFHLTLRFLGDDAGPDRLDRLAAALGRTASATPPLTVRPGATGAFPGWGRPRILWLGLEDGGGLAPLAAAVEEAARGAGFAEESRPFTAHLTLGRARGFRPAASIVEAVQGWRPDTGEETLEEMVLYRSELGPGGARHEPLSRHRLSGGGS